MRKKENRYKIIIIVTIIIVFIFSLLLYKILRINDTTLQEYKVSNTKLKNKEYLVHIDNTVQNNKYVTISGWIIKKNKDFNVIERHMLLKNNKTNKFYIVPTEVESRADLKNYQGNGYNNSYSGFISVIPKKNIQLQNYSVYILEESDNSKDLVKLENLLEGEKDDAK